MTASAMSFSLSALSHFTTRFDPSHISTPGLQVYGSILARTSNPSQRNSASAKQRSMIWTGSSVQGARQA